MLFILEGDEFVFTWTHTENTFLNLEYLES